MKKIAIIISVALITLSIMFLGYNSFLNNKIYDALNSLGKAVIVYRGQIINDDNIEVYKNSYEAKEEEVEKYLDFVNEEFYPKLLEEFKNLKYRRIEHIDGKDEMLIGLMNKDDTISVYFYDSGEVLVDINEKFYGFKTENLSNIKNIIENYKQEITNNPEFGWYLLF